MPPLVLYAWCYGRASHADPSPTATESSCIGSCGAVNPQHWENPCALASVANSAQSRFGLEQETWQAPPAAALAESVGSGVGSVPVLWKEG